MIDNDFKSLDVNTHGTILLGYSREEIIGKLSIDFIAPEYRIFVIDNVISGKPSCIEVLIQHKDGTMF